MLPNLGCSADSPLMSADDRIVDVLSFRVSRSEAFCSPSSLPAFLHHR